MSIKFRLALVLGLLLLGFLLSLMGLRRLERQEAEQILAETHKVRLESLQSWIRFTSRSLRQFTQDYAHSADLAQVFVKPPDESARAQLAENLGSYEVHAVWVLHPDGTVVFEASTGHGLDPHPLPISRETFARLALRGEHFNFFSEAEGHLLEISCEPIPLATAGPAPGRSRGWVMAARPWDARHLKSLASLTEGTVSLTGPGQPVAASKPRSMLLTHPLNDWDGQPLRLLHIDYGPSESNLKIQTDAKQGRIFIAFGLLVIVALGISVQSWVLRPLSRISESLSSGEATPLQGLRRENTELGRVALLIESSFAQRDKLRHEVEERKKIEGSLRLSEMVLRRTLEERAQLGRDLHDGVIQSLYAAGMGLAGVRALLRADQTKAISRLDQSRAVLNDTIHDVRNFITGLEPEALKSQSFAQAIAALLEFMQTVRTIRTVVEIDDRLASQLTLTQRIHALQIAREAVSNALRHGEAGLVEIRLQSDGPVAEFSIRDDGRGFTPGSNSPHGGLGLVNLAERARELGATLEVDSKPGQGTRVRFVIPLSFPPT